MNDIYFPEMLKGLHESLKLIKAYIDNDGPRFFSAMTPQGNLFLGLHFDQDDQGREKYLFSQISQKSLVEMERGELTPYSAISKGELNFHFECTLGEAGFENYARVSINDVSKELLPEETAVISIRKNSLREMTESANAYAERTDSSVVDISVSIGDGKDDVISADGLGELLKQTQFLVNAIAYDKKPGKFKLSNTEKEKMSLYAEDSFSASFGLRLRAAQPDELMNSALTEFSSLFSEISSGSKLPEKLKELQPRTRTYFKKFLGFLSKQKLNFKSTCAVPGSASSTFSLDHVEALRAFEAFELEAIDVPRHFEVRGYFDSYLKGKRFEILGDDNEVYRGVLHESIRGGNFAVQCRVISKMTENIAINPETGDAVYTYVLNSIKYENIE